MSKPALTFLQLSVERAPGFSRQGFDLGPLEAGINVVHGPNAAGKTTAARAVLALLWPRQAPAGAILAGRFTVDGDRWLVEVDHGARTICQRDGADTDPPLLPPADVRSRYYLPLPELLSAEDADLATTILREAAGGFDVDGAAAALGFRPDASRRRKPVEDLRAARERLEAIRRGQEELGDDEARLGQLEAQRDSAARARHRAGLLEKALEHAEASSRAREAEVRLGQLPKAMDALTGDEAARLAELDERIEEHEEKLRRAEAEISRLDREMAATELDGKDLPAGLEQSLATDLQELAEREARAASAEEERTAAERQTERALADLDPHGDLDTFREAPQPAPQALAELLKDAETLRARQELRQAAHEALGEPRAPADLEAREEALKALRGWLTTGGAAPGWTARLGLLLAAAALGSAAYLLAAGPAPPWLPWGAAGAGCLVLLLWLAAEILGRWGGGRRRLFREALEATAVAPPTRWRRAEVGRRFAELLEEVRQGRYEALKARLLERIPSAEGLRRSREELEARRQALADSLGAAPGVDILTLAWLAERVRSLEEAADALGRAEARLQAAQQGEGETLARLNRRLEPYGYPPAEDRSTAVGHVRAMEERLAKLREAQRDRRGQQTAVDDTIRPELEKAREQRQRLFADLGLDEGDRATLERWLKELPEHRELKLALHDARRDREAARAALEAHPELLEREIAALESELETHRQEAGRFQEHNDGIVKIRDRVEQAKKGHDLEEALTQRDACREALRQAREDDFEAVAGYLLAEHVKRETGDRNLPPVFHGARNRFAAITRGRYRLEVEPGDPPSFRAVDTEAGEGRALEELSSGTRVQLLLAVRLAFLEKQEEGLALPLLLDEVLANSDDERAAAVIRAVAEMARSGRQILAFTAQPDEVHKWQAVLKEDGGEPVPLHTLDLAAVRRLQKGERIPLRSAPSRKPVPPPEGRSHGEYGEILGIPGIDPRAPGVGGVHLWHLVFDPDLLHRLLAAGHETWGPFAHLHEQGPAGDVTAGHEEEIHRAGVRARALDAACRAWRVGRGRPVDRGVLEAAGLGTSKFFDQVATLNRELGGDARRLLEALQARVIKNFPTKNTEKLEAHFLEHGHLDPTEPLTPGDIRDRTLAAVADELRSGLLTPEDVDHLLAQLPAGG